eukprot:CAMPEP_0174381318 /NCGR_PEP_ID=MMETSP0811_2-20130205/123932_1 /TAXON_ID=73025 ORGANISM="Eutreptiella gymnastica-like, Strain CCMP1594" /NCGR_SAMPLE_ID=MMETSP0811_2 /ASSEMBLY_ACC=CAM_ASM_000667 /LENGTH=124 /DNA_ID=CAMNT_0015534421 /DNA_START=1497 /DNA_END=1872 /DNA_ORIENTATION=-
MLRAGSRRVACWRGAAQEAGAEGNGIEASGQHHCTDSVLGMDPEWWVGRPQPWQAATFGNLSRAKNSTVFASHHLVGPVGPGGDSLEPIPRNWFQGSLTVPICLLNVPQTHGWPLLAQQCDFIM